MSATSMTEHKEELRGRKAKRPRTQVSVWVDNRLLSVIDHLSEVERRFERGPMINVLIEEALIARSAIKKSDLDPKPPKSNR